MESSGKELHCVQEFENKGFGLASRFAIKAGTTMVRELGIFSDGIDSESFTRKCILEHAVAEFGLEKMIRRYGFIPFGCGLKEDGKRWAIFKVTGL